MVNSLRLKIIIYLIMGKYEYEDIFYLSKCSLTYQVSENQLTRYIFLPKILQSTEKRHLKEKVVSNVLIIKYKLKEVCRQLFIYIIPYFKI